MSMLVCVMPMIGCDDDTIKADFIVCEVPGQCGIRASSRRMGACGMNIIKRVTKGENHSNMETPEQNTQLITTTSSLSLPKLCKKTNSHKIENLIEYSHVPEDAQISETIPPLLSPYNIFKRQTSVTRSIRNLISTNRPQMKEYVQSSRLDQCSLRATNQEQYVDLEIPQYLIRSVVLTIFPNYNVSLNDNTLPKRLKIQVQITGTDQVPEAMSATLYVAESLDRSASFRRPIQSQEATFRRSIDRTIKTIFKNPDEGSTSMSPIFQTMMIQLVLKEDWCHVHAVTTEGKLIYTDKIDGHFIWDVDPIRCDPDCDCWMHDNDIDRHIILPKTKKMGKCKPSPPPQRRFDPDNGPWVGIHGKKKPLSIYEERLKILRKEGLLPPDDPTLVTWSPTDHCKPLHPPAVAQPIPCFMYSATTPEYDRQFPSLERKMDPITDRTSKPFIHPSEVQPEGKLKPLNQAEEVLNWQSENMVSQNEILQSLDKRVDKIAEKIDDTDEYLKMLEERIFGKTFDQKEREIKNLQGLVKEIDDFLRASHERKPKPIENSFFDPHTFPTYFKQPERSSPFYSTYVSSPPYQVRYIPTTYRPKSTTTATPSTSKTKGKASCLSASSSESQDIPETPPPKIQKEEEIPDKGFQAMAITRNYESSQKNHHLVETPVQKEDESSTDGDNNSDQEISTNETPRSVSSKSESEDNYIPRLFMANIKEEDSFFEEESPEETLIPERTKPNGGPWFTFDDVPLSRWRKRLLEFGAWLDTQMMKTSADSYKIIEEFCYRMTGTMKEWYHNIGTFKQDKLHRLETTSNILGVLHCEFIGDMEMFDRKNRLKFFEMKCCSLKIKDLDKHYHRMAQRYYVLNGYNDPSLKNTYVSPLPQELQPEIHRMLATTQRDIKTMSLGQIHQVTIEALEKLCSFHHQFSEVIEQKNNVCLQDSSPNEALSSESEDGRYLPIYSFKEIGSSLPTPPLSWVEVHVLATKFSRPKKVIAYMNTGAQITMMNPNILPAESWVTHAAYFVAADGKVFKTDLMTKEKIGIKFFPDCIVWTKAIGSNLPNKDIVVGMDVYSAASRLQILPTRIKFKREFKPYSGILRLYFLSKIPVGYEEIKSNLLKLCADSHEEFRHSKPLWKNKGFFVQLPFKLNEDVNPTKAIHPGMSPSDYTLAREECNQLLKQNLIEPTK
ncbi:hypothetical protein KIW84_055047 [Lathyrus oleraceus]|uniref:Polyprotein n=1 Tax=Pisum sativum TaxID=3888 RepID=A0A9D4WX05_PEA|nr:hypothetical protein KIW84_055047 [Pisum sativum]